MTSSEFAARYRLLKNVATHGARSFLAQQVELGRMVMVHYLDAESPQQQARTLARLAGLSGASRDKLLEIADVDGTPVAVTLFISSFVDFGTWLDLVSPSAAPPPAAVPAPPTPVPGDFTRAFSKLETPPSRTAGDFTSVFGKVDAEAPAPAPVAKAAPLAAVAAEIADAPTLIMQAVKPPRAATPKVPSPVPAPVPAPAAPPLAAAPSLPAAPPLPATPAPLPAAPADNSAGFTAIFGRMADARPTSAPPSPPTPVSPIASSPGIGERVMPPMPPIPDFSRPAAPPPSQMDAAHEPGEFTQLFQRLSPGGGNSAPMAAPAPLMPPFAPESVRSLDAPARADFLPPPALSQLSSLTPPPVAPPSLGLPVPSLGAALPAPPPPSPAPPAWGGSGASPNGGGVFGVGMQSEFTRILGRVSAPPPPPISIQAPAADPATAPQKPAKSMVPLIVALNLVVLLTIAIVAYFVLRK